MTGTGPARPSGREHSPSSTCMTLPLNLRRTTGMDAQDQTQPAPTDEDCYAHDH